MRLHHWISTRAGRGIAVLVALVLSGVLIAAVSQAAAPTQGKLDASIFSYDGQDFTRTKTTLMTADGKSAVNTKLDRDGPAYKALLQKHSYTGEVTMFGKKYDGNYAPLTSTDGKLTGALFVGTAR
jgi:Cache 3/Cache 2 fusion domain